MNANVKKPCMDESMQTCLDVCMLSVYDIWRGRGRGEESFKLKYPAKFGEVLVTE
jgi:hypothetical protein